MEMEQRQIGIRALELCRKQLPHVGRLRRRQAGLPSAKPHEDQFVIFAALQLERSAVGPIGNDRVPYVRQRQRTPKPGRIACAQISDQ